MVAKHKGSMKEDVDALFNGESLSEEFRTKATTIFEAAVQSRVEKIVEDVISDNDKILEEAVEGIRVELAEQVDEYLNYVVEQWVKDNEVAIESGLRAELSEDFINGLKNLFAEHYIDLPEEKLEVAESLAEKVVELEEAAAASAEKLSALSKELNEAKKNESIRKVCEGLTETQIAKMKSLAEGVEFTTEGEFNNKLAVIRENYFPNKKIVSEVTAAAETSEAQPEVDVPSYMANYVKAISKTLPK
jgi:DNA-binding ferritin-like protein